MKGYYKGQPRGVFELEQRFRAELEQEAPARIYGDWQASEYLGDVLAELKPRRKVNLPDFPAIVRAAMADDGMDICVYCQSFGCNECIVNEWKSERSDEE